MSARHFLDIEDFSASELKGVLALARELKGDLRRGVQRHLLKGKCLAMVFEKPSNRTRISFEVGMFQLGGTALNIHPSEIKMGEREPITDVARVLSRYVDAVMLRVKRHADLVEFARHSSVPVINGLSDLSHPCQALADMLTIEEKLGKLDGARLCFIGDGNNVCNSLIGASAAFGVDLVVACPPGYEPKVSGSYRIDHDAASAVRGVDVVYTDVWASMGFEAEHEKRIRDFSDYRVTMDLMKKARPAALFMHCLPAIRGEEVDDEVVESGHSVIFDQAENRLHTQKAILCLLMAPQETAALI